jgi:thiosulfate dehydrogenase [quinone] large subunit
VGGASRRTGNDDQEEDIMTATKFNSPPALRADEAFLAEPTVEETPRHKAYRYTLAVTRISLGWVFLWAFLDKLLALGFATGRNPETGVVDRFGDAAWINGASPTEGFLSFAAKGPFKGFYNDVAGAAWADWLFMIGLAGIGIALTLGVTMRIATVSGAVLLLMMWSAVLPPENNPFMDDHIVYALVLVVLALTSAGKTLGFGRVWERIPLVAKNGFLK